MTSVASDIKDTDQGLIRDRMAQIAVTQNITVTEVDMPEDHVLIQIVWTPTKEELAEINKGLPISLAVVGHAHPPVKVTAEVVKEQAWPRVLP